MVFSASVASLLCDRCGLRFGLFKRSRGPATILQVVELSLRRGDVRILVLRGPWMALNPMHGIENRLDHRFVSHGGVEHDVIQGTRGPVGIEVVLYISNALAVD